MYIQCRGMHCLRRGASCSESNQSTAAMEDVAVRYLGLAAPHQGAHEGHVATGGDVTVVAGRLVGGGFGAGSRLSRQAGLVH